MIKIRNIKPINCLFIVYLAILMVPAPFSNAESTNNVYQGLFQNKLSDFSTIYQNESIPGFNIYIEAKENMSVYPLYSFRLLMDCHRLILRNNMTKLFNTIGNKSATDILISNNRNDLFDLANRINITVPKTIASIEWLDLARRDIKIAREYLVKSEEYSEKNDYSCTLGLLSNVGYLLHKAKVFTDIANKKNNATAINSSKIIAAEKIVAFHWINIAENIVGYVESFKNGESTRFCKELLNKSKEYYDSGLYYLALMNAARAKVLAEYTHYHSSHTNRSEALVTCRVFLRYAELAMLKIHKEPTVDAPLAEMGMELAKLHFKDAENEEKKWASIPIVSRSIKESLTAREQALAALDLKKALSLSMDEGETEASSPVWEDVVLIVVVALVIISFMAIYIKRKK